MIGTLNDNAEGSYPPPADAHGQAALLLMESLLHGLIARKLIATSDAVEIVATASEVTQETVYERGQDPKALARSLVLLDAIATSLAIDLPADSRT